MSDPYQVPDKSFIANQGYGGYAPPSVCQPLAEKAFWMQLMGWVFLVQGILTSLSIIGAIFGVPVAMMGYHLKEAGNKYKRGVPADPNLQLEASNHLGTYFLINGIFMMIGLAFAALYLVALFAMLVIGGLSIAGAGN